MILSYFNSYFEIFVGLNLGYAAFDYFRRELATRIFRTNHLSQKLENLKSRLKSQISEKSDNEELSKALNVFSEKVDIQSKTLDINEEKERCFFEILKPISFLLSLLCLTYLIVAGFQESVMSKDKLLYSEYIFHLTCFIAVFSYTIFYCTFSERVIENELKVSVFQIIIGFIIFSTISCNSVFTYLFSSGVLQLLALLFVPIFTYMIMCFINILNVKKYDAMDFVPLIRNFIRLSYKNIIPTIIYLVLLIFGFIPVVVFYFNKDLIFIKYLVVLVTPIFLFLFITIRVYIHKKKFGKRYKTLSIDQTKSLDLLLESLD